MPSVNVATKLPKTIPASINNNKTHAFLFPALFIRAPPLLRFHKLYLFYHNLKMVYSVTILNFSEDITSFFVERDKFFTNSFSGFYAVNSCRGNTSGVSCTFSARINSCVFNLHFLIAENFYRRRCSAFYSR